MNENNLSEIELENDGLKIKLKKGISGGTELMMMQEIGPAQRSQTPREMQDASQLAKTPNSAAKTIIKSPMVGTFYAAPAPDAPPFVQPGSQVEVGQVICVIEAMKLMNEIKSEVRGKIAAIEVNNGDPVEFGQPLFLVE